MHYIFETDDLLRKLFLFIFIFIVMIKKMILKAFVCIHRAEAVMEDSCTSHAAISDISKAMAYNAPRQSTSWCCQVAYWLVLSRGRNCCSRQGVFEVTLQWNEEESNSNEFGSATIADQMRGSWIIISAIIKMWNDLVCSLIVALFSLVTIYK